MVRAPLSKTPSRLGSEHADSACRQQARRRCQRWTGQRQRHTLEDAAALRREIPDVVAASPEETTSAQAIANGRNWSTTIAGEAPEYLVIRDWAMASGSMFTDREVRGAAKVAVLGDKTAQELFGVLDPIGQTVRIGTMPFVIIGVLTKKGAGVGGGQDQDDRIVIPYTTVMKRITGDKYLRSVYLMIGQADRIRLRRIRSLPCCGNGIACSRSGQ